MIDPFPFADGVAGLIRYVFVVGLLVTSIVAAKKLAGSSAKNLTGWATRAGGAAAFGLGAWAGRQTIGRLGVTMADSATARRMAASDNIGEKLQGRALIGMGGFLGRSSFDVRGGRFSNIPGLDKGTAGQAQRGGYAAWLKAKQKDQEARNKEYGAASVQTTQELERAKLQELRAKEAHRRTGTAETLQNLDTARRVRELAEDKAKIEKADSQRDMARYTQGTLASTKGSGFARRAGTIWTSVVSPADRAAADTLEKSAFTDRVKAEAELARHEYERDDAHVKRLEAAIEQTAGQHAEAAKEANEELAKINENMEALIEEAKERRVWDETNKNVWQGGINGLTARDLEIQTGIADFRQQEKTHRAARDAAIRDIKTTDGKTFDQLKTELTEAINKRNKNVKGREAKEKKEREAALKIAIDSINDGSNDGKPKKKGPEEPKEAPKAAGEEEVES